MMIFGEVYEVLQKMGFSRAESAILLIGDTLYQCVDFSWTTKSIIGKIRFEEKRISDCIDSMDKKIYQIKLELLIVMFMAYLEEDMKLVEEKCGIDTVGVVR